MTDFSEAIDDKYKVGATGEALFGRFKPPYINFMFKSFQKQLAYKFEYFVGVLNGLIFIFIFTSLWTSIYSKPQAEAVTSFNKTSIIAYAIFAMLFRISMTMEDGSTTNKVRTGSIAMDLIKPVNYFLMMLAESMGQSMFHWFTRVAPIFLFCFLAFDISMPDKGEIYLLTGISWAMGYSIMFMINFVFALLAFWFVETFSFQLMKFGLFTLFAGGIVPIDFFPSWTRPLMDAMPFQYILYTPTAIFISHISGAETMWFMTMQLVWVAILAVICYRMWGAATRKLVTQGG